MFQSRASLSETETSSRGDAVSREILRDMRLYLHAERKTFTGATLVQYITDNLDAFCNPGMYLFWDLTTIPIPIPTNQNCTI